MRRALMVMFDEVKQAAKNDVVEKLKAPNGMSVEEIAVKEGLPVAIIHQWGKEVGVEAGKDDGIDHVDPRGDKPLFEIGEVFMTRGVEKLVKDEKATPSVLLWRHVTGSWGDLSDEEWDYNQTALAEGGQILSSYDLSATVTVWVITEWDRSVTTVLLPEEY